MKTRAICLLGLVWAWAGWAWARGLDSLPSSDYKPLILGVEQDLLPYFLRGYGLAGWAGMQRTRLRGRYSVLEVPSFALPSGVRRDRIAATELRVDFFWKPDFRGLWMGAGFGYWTEQLFTQTATQGHEVTSWVFGAGGGYNLVIWKGLYISPYAAFHIRLSGNSAFRLGGVEVRPYSLLPELSVKVGYKF